MSAGVLTTDDEGFSCVDENHDSRRSAQRMFSFAKAMLLASHQVRDFQNMHADFLCVYELRVETALKYLTVGAMHGKQALPFSNAKLDAFAQPSTRHPPTTRLPLGVRFSCRITASAW